MTTYLWLAAAFLLAVAGFAIVGAFRSPAFWIGLVRAIWDALLPSILRGLRYTEPKTPEERAKVRKRLKDLIGRGDK